MTTKMQTRSGKPYWRQSHHSKPTRISGRRERTALRMAKAAR